MGFRNPITTAADPVARQAAAAAQQTASAAAQDAANAQITANQAGSSAATANSAASTANTAAAAAQQTANTANTAAAAAQTAAGNAQHSADTANSAASTANTAAAAAQQTANSAQAATTNISATQIADGAITTPKIAAGAVTAGSLAAGSVTAGAIAAGSVKTAALDAGAVQAGNIAAGAVQTAALAAGAVTAGTIAAGAVQTAALAAGAVTAGTIAAGAVQAAAIAAGAIDGQTVTGALIRTAAAGQRVQIDSTNGLVGYNSGGSAVTQVRPSDGVLVAAGAQITGTLDTGTASNAPGVKVYNLAGTPATGAVEWRTGTMDSGGNASAKLTGGGSGGSAFTLNGGKTQLTNAPQVSLNVEGIAAGGYQSVLRLMAGTGGRIVADVALDPLVPATALPLNSTYFSIYSGTAYAPPTYWKLANGQVVLVGMVTLVSASFALGATVGTLPAGCRPAKIERFTATGLGNGAWIAEVMPTGAVTYAGASSGSPAAGSYISLAGITFPAEQ